MVDKPPLTDEQVYELLHQALLLFSHRTVATPSGRDVLTLAIRNVEMLQRLLIELSEGSQP